MGKPIPVSVSFNLPDGREVVIETGKLAALANGSVVIRCGTTMIFAVATAAEKPKPDLDFFPLSVDYQEKFASAGRIPGNFFRRETRLSDYEIIISRLIDRALRPLFPDNYRCETQIIINLLSGDKETMPDAFAALAASAAIAVSDIPIEQLISEVRVAKVNGEYLVNPTRAQIGESTLTIIVGATLNNVTMVEGEAKECQETELVEAIKVAHEAIKTQIHAQMELAKLVNAVPRELPELPSNPALKARMTELADARVADIARSASDKKARKKALEVVKEETMATLLEEMGEEAFAAQGKLPSEYFDKVKKNAIRMVILNEGIRLDGRTSAQIRPIWTEIDYLPSTHGSAIFTRGETQALTTLTLGTKLDEAMHDTAMEVTYEKFLLHYNFPGFSVGEVKPQRGPGRREVGHANLAARSLRQILPASPYTMRIVSDILESNGSSSMATVCAGSLALMDAGIQIPNHVAGIAMGMIAEGGKVAILSDILGDEDALGDMDFKLTGTVNGICGCQMDIKIDGLPYEQLTQALLQARAGRLHIIGEMNKTIEKPREDFKPHAPRVVEIVVDKDFIGPIIGPGGKIIQEIQRESGATITIEEKDGHGYVSIFATNRDAIDNAVGRINKITYTPQVGENIDGTVSSVMPYGVFVSLGGNKEGLLHVSEMSYSRIDNVEDVYKEGDPVKVQIIEVDKKTGKLRLSCKPLLEKPEGYVERPPQPRPERNDRDSRGGGRDDRRGGGGGGRNGGGGGGFRR
ncbi:MAG: hypothetical protein RL757_3216 [Bacteroidota bacterium]|jgi:polyribonucleotide nucleotidyltransferase